MGLLGMEGRGVEEGSSGSAGSAQGSALLPAARDSFFHRKRGVDRAGLILCMGFVHRGDAWHSPKLHLHTESSSRLGPFLISRLRPQGLSQRLAVACSSASTQPRATHRLGDHSHRWPGPGEQRRQSQREGGAAEQSRATGCQQRVVLPHVRPRQAPLSPGHLPGHFGSWMLCSPPLR